MKTLEGRRQLAVGAGGLMVMVFLMGTTLSSVSVKAASSTASVTVSAACSFTSGGGSYSETVLNGASATINGNAITTSCNDAGGYSLYAIGYSGDAYGGTNTDMIASIGSDYNIKTDGTGTYGSSWRMMIAAGTNSTVQNGFNNYQNIPSTYTKVASYNTNTTASTVTPKYEIIVSSNQPAGTYTGKVKYTLVHPSTAGAPTLPPYMQDLTSSTIAALLPSVGSTATVMDKRDGQEYIIAKLADGNYWMLDNLALDPTNASVQANLTTDTTNATDQALQCLKTGKYNGTTCASPYTTAAAISTSSFNGYNQALVNTASKDTLVTSYGPAADSNGMAKVGVYYNYCAASAGSYCYTGGSGTDKADTAIDAESDICPKGWRMPTGGPISTTGNDAGGGEYQALANAITGGTSSNLSGTDATNFRNALSTPLSGFFLNSSANNRGSYGFFWSSTYRTGDKMYFLRVNSSSVSPQTGDTRLAGVSVRCVYSSTAPYMQDLTSSTIAALLPSVGSTATVMDKRDGQEYTIAKLADGNYWMLDNLALDPTDASVKANLTTDTTNATDQALQCLKTGEYNGTTCASPYTTAAVLNKTSDFNSYVQAQVNTASKDTLVTSYGPAADSNGMAKVGVYYNYCAASAGSYCYAGGSGINKANTAIDAESDICPKGWRMPTGGAISTTGNNAGGGEYRALANAITGGTSSSLSGTDATNFKNALSTPLSGYFRNSSALSQGSYGTFWSSTYSGDDGMYVLGVNSSNVYTQNANGRSGGVSVRCVFGASAETGAPTLPPYMQDLTSSTIAALLPSVGSTATVMDKRDGQEYIIAKLADGNYWMLDNLALDPTNASVQANLTTDTTNATDQALQCLKTGKYNGTTCASPYTTAAVLNKTSLFGSYDQALVNTASKDTLVTSYGPAADSNGMAKVGVYYNYCAASAGSYCYANNSGIDKANTAIDAESDICPKGWRMPTGGPISTTGNDAGGGEYLALKNQYNTTDTATDTASLQYNLSTPLSGYFYFSSAGDQGSYGYFWSSTYNNGSLMYYLGVGSSSVGPQRTNARNHGYSVRCVFGASAETET